jgi:TIGR03009 family protein
MRILTLGLTLTLAAVTFAQAPPTTPPAAQPPAQPANLTPQQLAQQQRRDIVLSYWEQVMTSVQALEADCKRSTINKRFGNIEYYEGKARFLKSQVAGQSSRASLWMRKTDNPAVEEKIVLTGAALYVFVPSAKEVQVEELPKNGQAVDHNLMALLFGMKVQDAKNRYDITLKGEDANYFYLEIIPRNARDKTDFAKARLSLVRSTYLPAQLWFQQANLDEVQWDLPRVNRDANHLRPADFDRPNVPPGWKLKRVQPQEPVKIRGAGN